MLDKLISMLEKHPTLLNTSMGKINKYLDQLNDSIVGDLNQNQKSCNKEAGETFVYIVEASKDNAFVIPCVMDRDNKVISTGEATRINDFIINRVKVYVANK